MDSLSRPTTIPQMPPPNTGRPPREPRLDRVRTWLRTRPGLIASLSLLLLLGILVGMLGVLLYILSISADQQPLSLPSTPQTGSIIVQVSSTYISQIVQKNIQSAGLPGKVQNIHVQLAHNQAIKVTGDDVTTFLGIDTVRHFTILLQPYIQFCQLHVHVLHADLGGIPVTGFVTTFEGKINQQLQVKVSNLPQGFQYCTVGVHTESNAVFIVYSATPVG